METVNLLVDGTKLPYVTSIFPAGERFVKVPESLSTCSKVSVQLLSGDAESLILCVLLLDAIKRVSLAEVALEADYLPYSRQDRACTLGESNSLKVITDMVYSRFDRVRTIDIHNPKALLIENTTKLYDSTLINTKTRERGILSQQKYNVVIAPDRGAIDRAKDFSTYLKVPLVSFNKVRVSGGIEVSSDSELGEFSTGLIVDDICDGGATFLSLAARIRSRNPDIKLALLVSHGIFSRGFEELHKVFEEVLVVSSSYNYRRLEELTKENYENNPQRNQREKVK